MTLTREGVFFSAIQALPLGELSPPTAVTERVMTYAPARDAFFITLSESPDGAPPPPEGEAEFIPP